MNSGDLQYASGDVAIAGNLFVAGTVISSNPSSGGGVTSAIAGTGIGVSAATGPVTFSNSGILSVTAATPAPGNGPTVKCDTSSGAVVVSYAATSLANGVPSGVPVNSMYTPDTAVFPQVGAAPVSGNILVTGGQVLLGGTLPRGAIVCATKSGTTLPGAPANVAGTLEITNVGIAGVIADSNSFTGTAATLTNPALPGYVEFTSPHPGLTVRSSFLDGSTGSGTVEVTNVGVNSLAIKDSMADPLVGDVLVSSSSGISLSYTSTPSSTIYPSGLWNYTKFYKQGDHAGQEFSPGNFVWSLCLVDNVNYPPKDWSPPPVPSAKWEPVAYWTSTLPYLGPDVFATYLLPGDTIPLLYRSLQQATGIVPTNTAYWAIDGTPGIPSTSAQVIEISNSGVLSLQSYSPPKAGGAVVWGELVTGPLIMNAEVGSGIAMATGTSFGGLKVCDFANTGVLSTVAGTGIGVSGATGAVTISNAGVTLAMAGDGIEVLTAGGTGTGEVTINNTGVLSVVPNFVDYTLAGISVTGTNAEKTLGYFQPFRKSLFNSLYVLPVSGFGTGLGTNWNPWAAQAAANSILYSVNGNILGPWLPCANILHINQAGFSRVTGYLSDYSEPFILYTGRNMIPNVDPAAITDYSCLTLSDGNQSSVYSGSIQMVLMATLQLDGSYLIYGNGFLITPENILPPPAPTPIFYASFVLDI